MICPRCRANEHPFCPEQVRQVNPALLPFELAANSVCDCRHQPCAHTVRRSAQPTGRDQR